MRFLRALKHPKSTAEGRKFQLDFWQERIVRRIYGPRDANGRRIVSTVVILVPRGNRKTSFAAGLALLHTIGPEKVSGGEAVFSASDRKQAGIAFKEACSVVKMDKRLVKATRIYDPHNAPKKIEYPREGSHLEVISSDAARNHGSTPTFVLADELHVWPSRLLWEALTTGLDKTDDTLLVIATTAGRGQDNIAWDIIENARQVARGKIIDPSVLPVLFESDPKVDHTSEGEWRRVNPGSSHGYPSVAGFHRHVKRAATSPGERESLRQLKFNVWLDKSTSPFVDMDIYDKGNKPLPADIDGLPCWVAVDMSTTTDLTAVVACVRKGDDFLILPKFFCPEDDLRKRAEQDGVNYVAWAEAGFIEPTPGNTIDNRAVESYIRGLCKRFDVREIVADPAYSSSVLGPLTDDGLPTATMRQGWVTQSPALNDLEKTILEGRFIHAGHPVLRWCFSNVAIHTDSNNNRTMHKGKSTDRIDGASASWMAISRASAMEVRSMYDREDFLENWATF